MILALAMAVALVSPSPSMPATLSPDEIVIRAQTAWEARTVPPYVSFELACANTFLDYLCAPNATARFVVRTRDGRTFAEAAGHAAPVRVCGTFISGPASTPLGFFRTIGADNVPSAIATPAPPPNFAPDPFGLRPIASVVAKNRIYTVTLLGVEDLAGARVYHLQLVPNFARELHPLRELWVDTRSFEVVQLTYARRADSGSPDGDVRYRFGQVGPNGTWAIVRIEADLPVKRLGAPARLQSNLANVDFPTEEPSTRFDAPCPAS